MSALALGVAATMAAKAAVAIIKLRIGLLLSLDMSALPITLKLFIRLTPVNPHPIPVNCSVSMAPIAGQSGIFEAGYAAPGDEIAGCCAASPAAEAG
jgi:hypothetical protein